MSIGKLTEIVFETLLLVAISFSSQHWLPWILKDFFPRVLTVPVVAGIFVSLLVRLLWLGTQWGLVEKSPLLLKGIKALKRIALWLWKVAIGTSVVWMIYVLALSAWNWYRPRYLASRLTALTDDLLTANCLGMKIAGVTGTTAKKVLQYTTVIKKLPLEGQQIAISISVNELQQKGIIENVLLQEAENGSLYQILKPTALGQEVCASLLDTSVKRAPVIEPPKEEPPQATPQAH